MSVVKARYTLEHKLLPTLVYGEKESFILTLLQRENIIYDFLAEILKIDNDTNPYQVEDFKVSVKKIGDNILCVTIKFPEPEEPPLCYCAHIIFDFNLDKICYFTVENGIDRQNQSTQFLCSWDENETHQNYGCCNIEDSFDKALEIFKKY